MNVSDIAMDDPPQISIVVAMRVYVGLVHDLSTLLVLILIVSNTLNDHEHAIAHCSDCHQNKIYMSDLVSDKVESFVCVDNIFRIAVKSSL